ncbi:dihydroxyacetone phosphate acyltransferase [Chanos chanos]|uniref:Dihydroxyacetone phosphate acyltransferase n=1 Tax=Chanos chanos TaxID=29144 RepID=A0A6J2VWL9_CHACN|nr:dihydroxyacetone phosphate acyltransferase-like [Chanos chanos]
MESLCGLTLGADPEGFWDILEERRRSSDLSHALRTFNPQHYCRITTSSSSTINRTVLKSQYLRYITQEIAEETGEPVELVREEAAGILEEMAQNLQLGFIRLLAFSLSKTFKRLFSSIRVNEEGLSRLQAAIKDHPVILMPTHRSYVDFLVVSYILFTYDLPIPVIAAGIPLMGMKLIGEIFRRSGAFFIRRTIGSDKLYWAVLSEYVKTLVRTGFAPLEFYVEGLRSRTLKSLSPKLGMMYMILEPFIKGEVFDISLVPISISYDRVLEESLLTHELLGVPKPKETTMGLLKARKVLEENFGNMHVYFGVPVSVRDLANGKVNRSQYNLVPRDLPLKPSEDVRVFVGDVAQRVVRLQEQGMVLSPWSLMALVLIQYPEGLDWDLLTQKTLWLKGLALCYGARLDWPEQVSNLEMMSSHLALHHTVARCEKGRVLLVEEDGLHGAEPVSEEEGVLRRAAVVLICASYRNQALHVFVRPAMAAVAMTTASSVRKLDVFSQFRFLLDVFANEFIFIRNNAEQDFDQACALLQRSGAVCADEHSLNVTEEGQTTLHFLQTMLEPFIQTYKMVFRFLCESNAQVFTERNFTPAVRSFAVKLILSGELQCYECLSSDTQKNAISALLNIGAVTKSRVSEQTEFSVNKAAVMRIADTLDGHTPSLMISHSRL